jgi:hypothetical protein
MNLLARVTVAGFFALCLLSGCKSQGVGERCTVGLNSDCEQGLACVAAGTLYGVCCPPDQTCVSNPPETIDAATFDAAAADSATPDSAPLDGSENDAAAGDAAPGADGPAR